MKMLQTNNSDNDVKERLLAPVKRAVKQIMEETVSRKCLHEENASVIHLCLVVETCLTHGLKRRALGLFKTSSTTALLHKIAKTCPEADFISRKIQEMETADGNKRTSSSGDSVNKPPPLIKRSSFTSISTTITNNCTALSTNSLKYFWIRLALYEKSLVKICEYLAENADAYYDKDAFMMDMNYAHILCSLLQGPCSLEFTKVKNFEGYWSDPNADELVQRHRLSSDNKSPTSYIPSSFINFKRSLTTSVEDSSNSAFKLNTSGTLAKDYVESMHQNPRATLLYGKNNVQVLPKDGKDLMAGYLSLHQNMQSLIVKWTPNQLINPQQESGRMDLSRDMYWMYVLNINIEEIVYVHCHQNNGNGDSSGTLVFVGHDGVQRSPIIFPEGGSHMQQFLTCLEAGLSPYGQLDPPLWSQKNIGKIFMWPQSVRKRLLPSVMESHDEVPIDYVFRIVRRTKTHDFAITHSILDFVRTKPRRAQLSSSSTTGSSDCSSKSLSLDQYTVEHIKVATNQNSSIEMVCTTMKRQIISRAFYGWLAYCRHLSTVRTHLSGLVHDRITAEMKLDSEGLSQEKWQLLCENGVVSNSNELLRLVYYGGVCAELRKHIWPYLLGYYSFESTIGERQEQDDNNQRCYETTMSEWLAVDAIVQQKEKEKISKVMEKLVNSNRGPETTTGSSLDTNIGDVTQHKQDLSSKGINEENELMTHQISEFMKNSNDSGHEDDDVLVEADQVTIYSDEEGMDTTINTNSKSTTATSSYDTARINYNDLNKILPKDEEQVENDENLENSFLSSKYLIFEDTNPSDLDIKEDKKLQNEIITETCKETTSTAVLITESSVDINPTGYDKDVVEQELDDFDEESKELLQDIESNGPSPISSIGGIYSNELLEQFGLNIHRIEKDVQRCDRNYWYFANENLEKLRNIITTYVWEHLEVGYMQGMCDLVAPLLVIFDDEALTYGCFNKLMERMIDNFPNGGAMDVHFANMRSLIQILDPEMFDLMDSKSDYSHIYFCYRWFLLDFKREFVYDDVFATWEVIWAAKHIASRSFVLFVALALLEFYRDIILANSMDFTDVIKFFNEMAEHHNARAILQLARNLVLQLQMILENK